MYKVIEYFTDLHDNDHAYNVGDTFPREGVVVSDERVKELAGTSNRRGIALIEKVVTKKTTKKKATKKVVEE